MKLSKVLSEGKTAYFFDIDGTIIKYSSWDEYEQEKPIRRSPTGDAELLQKAEKRPTIWGKFLLAAMTAPNDTYIVTGGHVQGGVKKFLSRNGLKIPTKNILSALLPYGAPKTYHSMDSLAAWKASKIGQIATKGGYTRIKFWDDEKDNLRRACELAPPDIICEPETP